MKVFRTTDSVELLEVDAIGFVTAFLEQDFLLMRSEKIGLGPLQENSHQGSRPRGTSPALFRRVRQGQKGTPQWWKETQD